VTTSPLSPDEQARRRAWFRQHWETGVAFNRTCGVTVRRWELEGVELVMPYSDALSAHPGVFHGGAIATLIDTAGGAAVMAGHDFNHGSRLSTVAMSVQYLAAARGETVVAFARCTQRGRRTHFSDVVVRMESGVAVAQGLVTVTIGGERAGLTPGGRP
jgi:uncharacterized protein (TIGR00369 family)